MPARPGTITRALSIPFRVALPLSAESLQQSEQRVCSQLLTSGLFSAGHSLLDTATGAGIGARALAACGQVAPMTKPTVAANFHQPFDVHVHFAAQVSLHHVVAVNVLAQSRLLSFVQILDPLGGINVNLLEDLFAAGATDAVNVGERYDDALVRAGGLRRKYEP